MRERERERAGAMREKEISGRCSEFPATVFHIVLYFVYQKNAGKAKRLHANGMLGIMFNAFLLLNVC